MSKKHITLNSQQGAQEKSEDISPVKMLTESLTMAHIAAIVNEPTCEIALKYGTEMNIRYLLGSLAEYKETERLAGQIRNFILRNDVRKLPALQFLNALFTGPLHDLLLLFYTNGRFHEDVALKFFTEEVAKAREESKEFSDELDKAIADVKQCVAEAEVQELNQRKAKAEAEAKKQ